MFYYRYRPSSELAKKELLYDEIFFASAQECNDPFDGKAFLMFGPGKDRWKRLIECAWGVEETKRLFSKWAQRLSEVLAQQSPMNHFEALTFNYVEVLYQVSGTARLADIIGAKIAGEAA